MLSSWNSCRRPNELIMQFEGSGCWFEFEAALWDIQTSCLRLGSTACTGLYLTDRIKMVRRNKPLNRYANSTGRIRSKLRPPTSTAPNVSVDDNVSFTLTLRHLPNRQNLLPQKFRLILLLETHDGMERRGTGHHSLKKRKMKTNSCHQRGV